MNTDEQKKYEKALEYAAKKHSGQLRKDGQPYIVHPIATADILREQNKGIDYLITALFHDLLEDTDAEESEILELGGEKVLEAVKLLTKTDGYVMAEYIGNIKKNPIAFAVKGADRLHNLRSAFVADEAFRRRYIAESLEWFMDFDSRIPQAINDLEESLSDPIK